MYKLIQFFTFIFVAGIFSPFFSKKGKKAEPITTDKMPEGFVWPSKELLEKWKKDKWEFYKDDAKEFRYKRTSLNNERVDASTEGYKNLNNCIWNAIRCGYEGKSTTWNL